MTAKTLPMHQFDQAKALVDALGARIAASLAEAIAQRGQASLVVSGGSTPLPLFEHLCQADLPWEKVVITLADERWLPEDHADSNARLVREHLLVGKAAAAQFLSLYNGEATPEAGVAGITERLAALPRPIDVLILGMGNDGHTASLFPCAEELTAGLETAETCLAVHPTLAPHARLSLSLSALLNSRQIYLHLHGAAKLEVLNQAMDDSNVMAMPIRAVLNQRTTPVDVYWSNA